MIISRRDGLKQELCGRYPVVRSVVFVFVVLCVSLVASEAFAQAGSDSVVATSSRFRIGEKLSYTVTFGGFKNAAYFETAVVSIGKLSGRDAVELRSRTKTLDMVSAAFIQLDEHRIVFADPYSGIPIYIVRTDSSGAVPKDYVSDYLKEPNSNFDLLSLIYKARETAGLGTFVFSANGELRTATFVQEKPEKIKTEIGMFDTTTSIVQSDFLSQQGITQLKINFSTDEFHVPVLFRFKTLGGEFKASISAIGLPETVVETVTPVPTPVLPVIVPKPPIATPEIYVDNRPLLPELGFQLGESLDYSVTWGGRPAGVVSLSAQERKKFQN
ncbi:MAG: DUF3108 domain-containing protein, partial [Pyrinomonadaceae bacterium]